MDAFDRKKKGYLDKLYLPDRSKKGNVDVQIAHLIDKINHSKDYYTTSSCAGRICILEVPESGKKHEAEWLHVTHDPSLFEDVKQAYDTYKGTNDCWFRAEPAILHVCARDTDSAMHLIQIAKSVGFKRSGIMSLSPRIMIEIMGDDRMDALVIKQGKKLADDEYLRILNDEANEKMRRTRVKTQALFVEFN